MYTVIISFLSKSNVFAVQPKIRKRLAMYDKHRKSLPIVSMLCGFIG